MPHFGTHAPLLDLGLSDMVPGTLLHCRRRRVVTKWNRSIIHTIFGYRDPIDNGKSANETASI